MARNPEVWWSAEKNAWISAVGPVSARSGRRLPMKFVEGIDGRPLGPRDKARAQLALNAYLVDRDKQTMAAGDYTFEGLCQSYLAHSKAHAAPNTYRGHRKVLRLVCRYRLARTTFGAKYARDLTATDLDHVVVDWATRTWADKDDPAKIIGPKKPTYISRMVASVQAVLNWAAEPRANREPERLIPSNPLRGYRSAYCQVPESPDRYASDDEVKAFLEWGRGRARKVGGLAGRFDRLTVEIVYAMAMTGARPGELCDARWSDFTPRKVRDKTGAWWGLIVLPPKRHKTGGKTGKPREIYLPERLVRKLEAIKRLEGRHPEFVWTHRRGARSQSRGAMVPEHGEPWNSNALSRRIKEFRRMAIAEGVPLEDSGDNRFVAYRLRHTAAAKLLMAGEDIYTVAKLLGTSAQMIQRTYGSLLRSRLADAASGLE